MFSFKTFSCLLKPRNQKTEDEKSRLYCYNVLRKDFKTADRELSEQLEYKCYLAKVKSTLNFKWYVFALMCFKQN